MIKVSHSMQTILVTGANRGIGLEFARQFSQLNNHVIATTRNQSDSDDLMKLSVQVETLDISDQMSLGNLKKQLANMPVDVLINNAGIGINDGKFEELDLNEVTKQLRVNCVGTLGVIQSMIPNLKLGEKKTVINISSKSGSIYENIEGTGYGYRASKAALNMVTKNLSIEYAADSFIFVSLHPGHVRTDLTDYSGINVKKSVKGMINVIEKLDLGSNGKFFDYMGKEIAW